MKDIFRLLKIGVTKSDYPLYGQYINSTGKQLQTYNKSALVCINYELPFKGSTQFFVLENLLTNLTDPIIKQDDTTIFIEADNFKSRLIIDDVGFPVIPKHNYKSGLIIDDELLYILNFATKFIDKSDLYSYVVVTDKGVIATDKKRLFCFNHSYNLKNNIFLNKRIITSLQTGYELNFDENVFVKFDNGYMIFEIDDVSKYSVDNIYNVVMNYADNTTLLCSMSYIQDVLKKVASVLINESFKYVTLFNKNNKLTISAESSNGDAVVEYESGMKKKFELNVAVDNLSDIGIDYDIYVDTSVDNSSFLYLKNSNCEIVIAGVAV